MSPLNRGPLLGPRVPPVGVRPLPLPPPRFGGRLVPPGMPPRIPGMPPISPVFGGPSHIRQRLPPPPPRPAGVSRPNGLLPLFPGGPRARGMAPGIGPRGNGVPRGPIMRPWPRRIPLPQMMPPLRPRYATGNGSAKGKAMSNTKKVNKLEELELKKPWMTDEIRSEIQKKNKLYAKAKKNKDAVEWEEFKDLRNKVTRMIRDAKNEYLAKHPEQGGQKTDDSNTIESEGVQKTENSTEQSERTEQTEETQPSSEQAHLYPDEEPYDQRDENYVSSEDDTSYYCEVCDRDFPSEDALIEHKGTHRLCGIDGCTFSAHPLLVEKHISMQHSTGLYQRMKDLLAPEDIEKWIMERKKRYPTRTNIELRKTEEQEKVQRGEIIKQDYNIQIKTKKTVNMREKKRKFRKRHIREASHSYFHKSEIYRGLRPFPGTIIWKEKNFNETCFDEQPEQLDVCKEVAGNISDEDDALLCGTQIPTSANLSIPSLVADYVSEEDEIPEEVPIKRIKMEDHQDYEIAENNSIHTKVNDKQSCGGDVSDKQMKANEISRRTITKYQNKNKYEPNRTMRNKPNEKDLSKYNNRLLQKLLSRSIQHERNLICQCLKYIMDNNFFD